MHTAAVMLTYLETPTVNNRVGYYSGIGKGTDSNFDRNANYAKVFPSFLKENSEAVPNIYQELFLLQFPRCVTSLHFTPTLTDKI
jgi:hypothetical protein